jgi:hypothetical protein
MLPFHMLVVLPTRPSPRLDPFVPLSSSLFSVTSALRSPRSVSTELPTREHQPNHFPLFPHPVNIAHAGTPVYPERLGRGANPSSSIVYFTTCGYPGGGVICLSRRLRSHLTPCANTPAARLSPLDATLTKNQGRPHIRRRSLRPSVSLPLYFITSLPQFRYTIPFRQTP